MTKKDKITSERKEIYFKEENINDFDINLLSFTKRGSSGKEYSFMIVF